jgi:hypothetical protein
MIGNQGNNLRIDPSAIAQTILITVMVGLTTTLLQLRQDVAVLREQTNNYIVSKEFAAFKTIAEQHDLEFEKRLERLEKQMENRK